VVPFREKGIPSVQQIEDKTADFNRYYHTADDTVDHMDHDYWLAMERGLVAMIGVLAEPQPAPPPVYRLYVPSAAAR